jgi:hypothetical protein
MKNKKAKTQERKAGKTVNLEDFVKEDASPAKDLTDSNATEDELDESLIDPEIRDLIHKDLLKLSKTPYRSKNQSIAPALANAFSEEIKAVRKQGHSWESIIKVIRKHGLRVSEEALKSRLKEMA